MGMSFLFPEVETRFCKVEGNLFSGYGLMIFFYYHIPGSGEPMYIYRCNEKYPQCYIFNGKKEKGFIHYNGNDFDEKKIVVIRNPTEQEKEIKEKLEKKIVKQMGKQMNCFCDSIKFS